MSRPALGPTQLSVEWVPGVKRPERAVDRWTPSSAEVKSECNYTPTLVSGFLA